MTNKLSSSPARGSFQKESYIKRQMEKGEELNPAYIKMYDDQDIESERREADVDWQKNNMEYDLRTTDWILEKVRDCDIYAQHLYAAMCNNEFQRNDVYPILADKKWGCSWRYAGGIIADMQEKGDYIDWYCSGIRNDMYQEESSDLSMVDQEHRKKLLAYVSESVVTQEIKDDLFKLGWVVLDIKDENI